LNRELKGCLKMQEKEKFREGGKFKGTVERFKVRRKQNSKT